MFAYEDNSSQLAGYVRIPYPSLKISEEWVLRNKVKNIPKDFIGKIIPILGIDDGKTYFLAEDIVYEIEGIFSGDFCLLESKLETWDRGVRVSLEEYDKESLEIISFDSLKLPSFLSYVGEIPYGRVGSGNSKITYRNTGNWRKDILEKDSAGKFFVTYTLPIAVQNEQNKTIKNLDIKLFLQGDDNKKYFAKNSVEISELKAGEERAFNFKVKAPPDDPSLRPFIENFGRIGSQTNWVSEAFSKEMPDFPTTAEDIEEHIIEYLKLASTKNGYYKILSSLSFLYLKTGQFEKAIAISEKILQEETDTSVKEFMRLQKIIALIKMHKLNLAVKEIGKTRESTLPIYYLDYLARCCLRQIEREKAFKIAEENNNNNLYLRKIEKFRKESMNTFKANVVLETLIKEDEIKNIIVSQSSIQGQFERASGLYKLNRYEDVEPALLVLNRDFPEEIVFKGELAFKLGPAALDMLGNIYSERGDFEKSSKMFNQMMNLYKHDIFFGPSSGEGFYGGPAGAEALRSHLYMLNNAEKPDNEEIEKLAFLLIEKFDGIRMYCWEGCSNYEEIASRYLLELLKRENKAIQEWDRLIRRIISMTENRYLSASLLLELAKKNEETENIKGAISIYQEIMEDFGTLYMADEYAGFLVYSLEGFKSIVGLYKNGKMSKKEFEVFRQKAKSLSEQLYMDLTKKNLDYYIKIFKPMYEEFLDND